MEEGFFLLFVFPPSKKINSGYVQEFSQSLVLFSFSLSKMERIFFLLSERREIIFLIERREINFSLRKE